MYLHIGKEYVLNEKNIIGIFNIDDIKKNKECQQIYEKIKDDVIDISDGNKKTLVLVDDKLIKGYITNISSMTLQKRIIG